jgi:hypothetical protein
MALSGRRCSLPWSLADASVALGGRRELDGSGMVDEHAMQSSRWRPWMTRYPIARQTRRRWTPASGWVGDSPDLAPTDLRHGGFVNAEFKLAMALTPWLLGMPNFGEFCRCYIRRCNLIHVFIFLLCKYVYMIQRDCTDITYAFQYR